MFTAVVLDELSQAQALASLECFPVFDSWEPKAHHVTLCMGEGFPLNIGEFAEVTIDAIGWSNLAVAFRVSEIRTRTGILISENKVPHITLAVNREAGGKPVDSNKITDWLEIIPHVFNGVVKFSQ